MDRVTTVFSGLKAKGKKALIPYIMAGYPNIEATADLIVALDDAGADIVEVGIPWSDPLADGVTIQKASETALAAGMNTDKAFGIVRDVRKTTDIPLIIMTYYNLVLRYGLEQFAKSASEAGCDGVILPDLSVEEAREWRKAASKWKIDTIFLVAPTSTDERISKVTAASQGFVYCVSLAGVTGARQALPRDLKNFIGRVRIQTDKPLAVGFGISTPEQAHQVAKSADGVIIGSALLNVIAGTSSLNHQISAVKRFIKGIKAAL